MRVKDKSFMGKKDTSKILIENIEYIFEWTCQNGGLKRPEKYDSINNKKSCKAIADLLISQRRYFEEETGINFYLLTLRETDGSEMPFVHWVPHEMDKLKAQKRKTDTKKVFVGHRFTDQIKKNFRHNLGMLLSYYGFSPYYSDTDFPEGQIFENIIKFIKKYSFSIFDTKDTKNKPNVYIEIGAAHVFKKPYFIFQSTQEGKKDFPSDLSGFYTLRYKNYKELFREFSLHLPYFIRRHELE